MKRDRKRVACGACGSLNNPKWEFCARCGESLQAAAPQRGSASRERPPIEEVGFPTGRSLWSALALVGIIGLGILLWTRGWQGLPEQKVAPALFAMPTTAAQPPPAAPPASPRPGLAALAEGRRLLAAGKTAEALVLLAQAVAEGPQIAECHAAYSQALWASKQADEAVAQARDAARLDARFRLDLARSLAHAGKAEEAAREYEALLAGGAQSFDVVREAGAALAETRDYAKAVAVLRRAVEMQPFHLEAQRGLAVALDKSGDAAGAIDAYRKALDRSPGLVEVRARLADMLVERGNPNEGVLLYREGVQRNPRSATLRRSLGWLLESTGRSKEAAVEYREYVKLVPDAEDAKRFAERAERLDPQGEAAGPPSGS